MNAPDKTFTGYDKKQAQLLGKLMHKIVQMRIQKRVREEILKNDPMIAPFSPSLLANLKISFEDQVGVFDTLEQRSLDETISSKCLAESEHLMYMWICLLRWVKIEHGLSLQKISDFFSLRNLPITAEMFGAALSVSDISFMIPDDMEYVLNRMAEPPRLGFAMVHVRELLR